jgi:hypothetical protein
VTHGTCHGLVNVNVQVDSLRSITTYGVPGPPPRDLTVTRLSAGADYQVLVGHDFGK